MILWQAGVAESVVKPVRAGLPELHDGGVNPVSAPIVGEGDRPVGILEQQFLDALVEGVAVGNDAALLRNAGTNLADHRSAVEINLRLLPGYLGGSAFDADLPLQ